MIIESNIKSLKEEKVNLKDETVESSNVYLPKLYMCSMFIGSKGSGKTWSLVSLLKHYERSAILDKKGRKHTMRTILFCPTGNSDFNKIYTTLESLDQENDVILDYSDDKLLDKLHEIEEEKKFIEEYKEYVTVWKKYMKIDEDMSLLTHDELLILSKFDFTDPENMKKPEYKHPRINFLIFDDLVGDAHAFKKSHSALNNLCIKHRHLQCNLIFTTQYIKAIPPVIRRNLDIFIIFKFANVKSVTEQIYPEISGIIKEEEFELLFDYATENKHNALIIDQTSKQNIFKLNWDVALKINNM